MVLFVNSGLVSRLESPEVEINFYFSKNCLQISRELEEAISPLKINGYEHGMRIYQGEDFKEDYFYLMDNEEDWLYDDNELKNYMINEFGITPQSLLFYQNRVLRHSAELTKLIADYLIGREIEFFLVGYGSNDKIEDTPIYVNKRFQVIKEKF